MDPKSETVDFILITGFLGSGKTTLLKNILQAIGDQKRIAIIQNEFAPTSIDGKELKSVSKDFRLVEINNGSVFCVCQLGNFVQNLEKLINDYAPEIVFLEASGLADPVNIIELLQAENIRSKLILRHIIGTVDASSFYKGLNTLPRFRHQIMISDTIILNKQDLFTGDYHQLEKSIRELNPFAYLFNTSFCQIDINDVINPVLNGKRRAENFSGKKSEGKPDFNACVLRTHDSLSEEGFNRFIRELMLSCPRIKGFVKLVDGRVIAVQTVFDQLNTKVINNYDAPTEIIIFSRNLTVKELHVKFKTSMKFE